MHCVGVSASPDGGDARMELPLSDLRPTTHNIASNFVRQRIGDPRFALLVPIPEAEDLLETGVIRFRERDYAVGIGFKCNVRNVFNTVLHNVYATTRESGFLNTPAYHALPFSDTDVLLHFMDAMRLCVLGTMQSFEDNGGVTGTVQTTDDTVAYIIHFSPLVPKTHLREAAVYAITRLIEFLREYGLNVVDVVQQAAVGAPGDYVAPPDAKKVYEYEYSGDDVTIKLTYDNKKTLFEMVVSAPPGEHFDVGDVTNITGAGRPRGASSASSPVAQATQDKLNRLLKMVKEWEPEIVWKQDVVIGFVRGELGATPSQEPVYDNKRFYSHCGMFRELCYSMGWKLHQGGHVENSYMLHTIISQTERQRDRRVVGVRSPQTPSTPEQGIYNIQEGDENEEEEENAGPEWSTPEQPRRINFLSGWFDDEVVDGKPALLAEDARRHIYSFLSPMEQAAAAQVNNTMHGDIQPNINRVKKETQNAVQRSMLQHGGGYRNYLELKPPNGSVISGVAFATSLEQSGQGALELNFSASLPEGTYWAYSDFARFQVLGNAIRQPRTPLADPSVRQAVAAWVNAVFALARRYGVKVGGGHVAERALSFYMWSNKGATVQRDLVMQLQSHGWRVVVKHGRATLGVVHTPHWVGAAFDELPPELKAHIIKQLAPRDRAAAQQVNHQTNALIKMGQHGNRLQVHASITEDLAKKSFVTYELLPQGGTPAVITLSLQKPEAISLTIVTPFNNLIDYHGILDYGLQHRANNVNLEEMDEPLDEALQTTVHTAVSLFMGALALYKTPVHYSGVNTNYVTIWAKNRSRYRDIAARFVVDLAQQGWTVTKAGVERHDLVVEDFVGGIFENDERSDALPEELRSRIYSFMDMPALTNFQVTKPAFNKEVESRRWMLKHAAMDSLTKWFDSLDYNKRAFKLEYIAGRRGVRELPKGIEDVEVQATAFFSMSVTIRLEESYESIIDKYITFTGTTMDFVANHMRTGYESTAGARGFIRFVCREFQRILRSRNLTGPQIARYDVYTHKLTLSVHALDAGDEAPFYAEWMYIFLSKGIELGVTSVLHGGRGAATSLKRPEPLYLPEYIEHEVEQSIQEEMKARGREEPEDNERRVRQRLEGIFEEDEATPELGDDPQRRIYSFLDMASLTNLQASSRKLNTQVGLAKETVKERVFSKVKEWAMKVEMSRLNTPQRRRWFEYIVVQHNGVKQLPEGIKGVTLKMRNWYAAVVKIQLSERIINKVGRIGADHLIRDLGHESGPRYGIYAQPPKQSTVAARRFVQWMLSISDKPQDAELDAYSVEFSHLYEKKENAREYMIEVMYQLVMAGYAIAAVYQQLELVTGPHGSTYWTVSDYATRPLKDLERMHVPEELEVLDDYERGDDDDTKRQRLAGAMEDFLKGSGLHGHVLSFLNDQDIARYAHTTDDEDARLMVFKDRGNIVREVEQKLKPHLDKGHEMVQMTTRSSWLEGISSFTVEYDAHFLRIWLLVDRDWTNDTTFGEQYNLRPLDAEGEEAQRRVQLLVEHVKQPDTRRLLRYVQLLGRDENILTRAGERKFTIAIPLRNDSKMVRGFANLYVQMLESGLKPTVVALEGEETEDGFEWREQYSVKDIKVPRLKNRKQQVAQVEGQGELDDVISKLKSIKVVDQGHNKLVSKLAKMAQR